MGGGCLFMKEKKTKAINTLLCSKLSPTRAGSKAFKGKHRAGGRVHFNLSINYSSKFSLCTFTDAPITRIKINTSVHYSKLKPFNAYYYVQYFTNNNLFTKIASVPQIILPTKYKISRMNYLFQD